MTAEIIPFDFEEQAVRVVMRDGEPWFVAADVCRVLDLGNPTMAIRPLDDDERMTLNIADATAGMTLNTSEGQTGRGGARFLNIISESGLYALIFTSRKDSAKRFRKWVTAEVLPAIRRTGRYEAPELEAEAEVEGLAMPFREAEMWLGMVREARLTRGTRAATHIWDRSPLPRLSPETPLRMGLTLADGRTCLARILGAEVIDGQTAGAMVLDVRAGDGHAELPLTRAGLRVLDAGLFVSRGRGWLVDLFAGTDFALGRHADALALLPGALRENRTLSGTKGRGVLVPWAEVLPMLGEGR